MKSVSVIGLGYIGLPTAAVLASAGLSVTGVDVRADVLAAVNDGRLPFVEPGLAELVREVVSTGKLRAAAIPVAAYVHIIAVPTPITADKQPDLSFVDAATDSIAPHVRPGDVVILESTSPVGTTERLAERLTATRPEISSDPASHTHVHIAYCPERVLPGKILSELVANDRVIGGLHPCCTAAAIALYEHFVKGACIATTARTAEMVKLTENAFRDVNIAFANELSLLCDRLGVDVWELIALANRHPRVQVLQPGPGVGGHCIAVDPWFLAASAPELAKLIRTAREVNDAKPDFVAQQVLKAAKGKPTTVACLGLTFKADIDDVRESPAVAIVAKLAAHKHLTLLASDPHLQKLPQSLTGLPNVRWSAASDAIKAAAIVLGLVDHAEYRALTPEMLSGKTVLDPRGMWR